MTSQHPITSTLELLRDHIGHRTVIREPKPGITLDIKCIDCTRTIDLTSVFGLRPGPARPAPAPSSQRARRDPQGDEQCPAHPGEWRENCRCCAAEAKALPDGHTRVSEVRNGTDPNGVPEVAAARERLAELARTRSLRKRQATPAPGPVSPPAPTVDPVTNDAGGT